MKFMMDVAIIGMSCRFPEANNIDEFWTNLVSGRNSVRSIPKERWYMSGEGDLIAGFLKCPLDEFDCNFFNISPKEAPYIDPQQRLFLEVSWESLENACIPPTSLNGTKTGVYLGIGSDEYFRTQLDSTEDTMYKIVGNAFSAATGRLSFFLNLRGPSVPIEAACASSALSIHLACVGLRNGECSLAIAGGVNVLLETSMTYPTALVSSSCRSFDASASGFAPAEGCGVIILKLLPDAINEGNKILGIIKGSSVNHTGKSTSFGTPNAASEEQVIRDGLRAAGVAPRDVTYVEAHAGGTSVGDPIEVSAISSVFTDPSRQFPLIIGAFKTNIGHPLSAAGVAGVIKMLLCIKHRIIPQHLHLQQLHPEINLQSVPAMLPLTNLPWHCKGPLIGALNCFGITGTNVHMVIQEPPLPICEAIDHSCSPPTKILTISSKDDFSLEALRCKYKDLLDKNEMEGNKVDLIDLAYSSNITRSHLPYRIAVTGSTIAEMSKKLGSLDYARGNIGQSVHQPIAFLFTGHCSQYLGMAKALYNTSLTFREAFDKCDIIFCNNLGITLRQFIWEEGHGYELSRTKYSQPAIFAIEYCLFKLWTSFGVRPDFVVGHSIGEFAACVAAGIISFEDGMKLVCCRSILVDTLPNGSMVAIGAPLSKVVETVTDFMKQNEKAWLDIACINSPEQTVISTENDTAIKLRQFIQEQTPDVKSKILPSQHAFHSRSMDPILKQFEEVANEVQVNETKCKYISGLLNREIKSSEINGQYWRHHCRNPVSFINAIDIILQKGCKIFVEVGPQPTLLNFLTTINANRSEIVTCPSIRNIPNCWTTFLGSLSKIFVNSNVNINFDTLCKGNKVELPNYCFNRKKYWAPQNSVRGLSNGPTGQKMYHSLLGWKLNLARSKKIRFYNYMSVTSTGYVHDHVIADHVIVPAACYVEMILTLARKEFDSKYPTIENFQVLRPLLLEEKPKQIQTKVEVDGTSVSVAIFSELNEDWVQNAQATLNLDLELVRPPESLLPEQIEKIQTNCSEDIDKEELYRCLDEVGISMGPHLKSLEFTSCDINKTVIRTRVKSIRSKEGEFICHPILVDAMVQLFWEYKMRNLDKRQFALPVGVNKLVWYGNENSTLTEYTNFYIKHDEYGILYDDNGKILAEVEGVNILHSSVSLFLKSVSLAQALPQFMTKDTIQLETMDTQRVDMNKVNGLTPEEIQIQLQFLKEYTDTNLETEKKYGKLTYLNILRTLVELGWKPVVGIPFRQETMVRCNPPTIDIRAYGQFLKIFEQEGLVKRTDIEKQWVLLENLPTVLEIEQLLTNVETELDNTSIDFAYAKHLGKSLTNVLMGELNPVDVLFSNKEVSLTRVYAESFRCIFDAKLLANVFRAIFTKSTAVTSIGKLRILEVGAGTGSATSWILNILNEFSIPFYYTFTDIGPSFLEEAKVKFSSHRNNMNYKVLDIEKDPKCQGFAPYSYDIVIALQVLHATEDLRVTCENVRHLLVPDGYLFLSELVDYYRDFAVSFDLLKSYWRMSDSRDYVTVNASTWLHLLDQTGFKNSVNLTIPESGRGLFVGKASSVSQIVRPFQPSLKNNYPAWIIFGMENNSIQNYIAEKLNQVSRLAFQVVEAVRFDKVNGCFGVNSKRVSDFQQLAHVLKNYRIEGIIFLWGLTAVQTNLNLTADLRDVEDTIAGGFLNVLKMKINNTWTAKIFLVTNGAEEINPAQGTLWGMFDTYLNEYPESTGLAIDLDQSVDDATSAQNIFNNLWYSPNERGIYLKNGETIVVRAHTLDSSLPVNEIVIPATGKYKLMDPTAFKFAQIINDDFVDSIEISVRAVGLNFRDLLLSSAVLQTDYPDSVGLEFAGVVSKTNSSSPYKVGDRVAGLTCAGALTSHIRVENTNLLFQVPTSMSYFGAATLPVAYGTCYLAMVQIAQIKPGEKVLIHTGSGGVGLAGIQLAKLLDAEIFVTAGTDKKRKYLKDCLGLTHVYNSRTKDYKQQILHDTNGTGIDIVLNTLTGSGFKEATLECTAQNGRFIELSKLNIWTEEEVRILRPDVSYSILDAFDMILKSDQLLTKSLANLSELFNLRKLDILYHCVYPLSQVKSAFKYFHSHKHIGKIVVEIPVTADKVSSLSLFNSESTYLVTGGIGGLGFEVGKYLWGNDAHILLVGRSTASEDMKNKIAEYGERMRYVECDVGDYEKCKALLETVNPPLRGIFHCAGVFANGFIVSQSSANYTKSFHSKIYGTWNLHQLTKDKHLDHFVMFSSIAAVVGSTGLSNYCAANRYLDSLTHFRVNQCGLPGLTINWGPWAEVGIAADYITGMFKSFFHFSPQIGIQSMERAIRLKLHDVIIADMDNSLLISAPKLGPYFSELTQWNSLNNSIKVKGKVEQMVGPSDPAVEKLGQEILTLDGNDRIEKMESLVEIIFRVHSGLTESDVIDRDQPLALMGMDSLIGMEMRLRISKLFDIAIPTNAVQEHNSVSLFSAYLLGIIPTNTQKVSNLSKDILVKVAEEVEIPSKSLNSQRKKEKKNILSKFVAKRLQKLHNSDKKQLKVEGTNG